MARRFRWSDAAGEFGAMSILLHWLVAALVLALVALGLLMQWTIRFEDPSLYLWLKHAHISVGMLLCAALLPRVAWRLVSRKPVALPQMRALRLAARIVPVLLLLGVVLQSATGVAGRWTDTRWILGEDAQWRIVPGAETLPFFGLFELASPVAAPDMEWNAILERMHGLGAWLVMALLALHVLGALRHLLIGGTGAMRMLRPAQCSASEGSEAGRGNSAGVSNSPGAGADFR